MATTAFHRDARTGRMTIASGALADSIPAGWFAAGTRPADYVMTVDHSVLDAGRPSARIEARSPQASGFGTLMQQMAADRYRGRRVRFAGDVRVRDVTGWAALWMRVDGAGNEMLAFDNAQDRAAKGTADWRHFDIVLDVPAAAKGIFFGTLLSGGGTAWVSGLTFAEVPLSVPVTAGNAPAQPPASAPASPVNLDFTASGK